MNKETWRDDHKAARWPGKGLGTEDREKRLYIRSTFNIFNVLAEEMRYNYEQYNVTHI